MLTRYITRSRPTSAIGIGLFNVGPAVCTKSHFHTVLRDFLFRNSLSWTTLLGCFKLRFLTQSFEFAQKSTVVLGRNQIPTNLKSVKEMSQEQQNDEYPSNVKRFKTEDERDENNATVDIPKVVNDPIHGHIELSPVCVAVIDTKQFQRLRFIKQTGFCYFVYPGASHNRFEHSLGVSFLAGEAVRMLKSKQPELGINDKDVMCVELAGLCHDLGHGPFSHTFDGKFIPKVCPEAKWTHEKASLDMLDYLVEQNDLMGPHGAFTAHGLSENDVDFIKEMIYGPLNKDQSKGRKDQSNRNNEKSWPYKGRPESKSFLYEIVSNKRTGIDVDKWDYFARDCHHLGIRNNFDHNRFVKFMRVLKNENGRLEICARDKEIGNLHQMFYIRYILHRSAYQHKVNCAIEMMVVDALTEANDHLKFPGKNGDMKKMSECINDMEAYFQLTDHIFWQIINSKEPKLKTAREILERVLNRDLYCCLEERTISNELLSAFAQKKKDIETLSDDIVQISKSDAAHESLTLDDFRLQSVYLDFGMKDKNPLEKMQYYSKKNPDQPVASSEKGLLKPPRFKDSLIRVYSCKKTSDTDYIKFCFNKICEKWNMTDTHNPWDFSVYSTPQNRPEAVNYMTPVSAGKRLSFSS